VNVLLTPAAPAPASAAAPASNKFVRQHDTGAVTALPATSAPASAAPTAATPTTPSAAPTAYASYAAQPSASSAAAAGASSAAAPGAATAAAKKAPTVAAGAPIPGAVGSGGVVPPDESVFEMNLEELQDKPWRKPGTTDGRTDGVGCGCVSSEHAFAATCSASSHTVQALTSPTTSITAFKRTRGVRIVPSKFKCVWPTLQPPTNHHNRCSTALNNTCVYFSARYLSFSSVVWPSVCMHHTTGISRRSA
jgi:hypothetical protein